MSEELKPCPFCGHGAKLKGVRMGVEDSLFISCLRCSASTTPEDWNTRALNKETAWAAWQECDRAWRSILNTYENDGAVRQAFDESRGKRDE